jgi:hypothetical protein
MFVPSAAQHVSADGQSESVLHGAWFKTMFGAVTQSSPAQDSVPG